jgi:hypothetical protein
MRTLVILGLSIFLTVGSSTSSGVNASSQIVAEDAFIHRDVQREIGVANLANDIESRCVSTIDEMRKDMGGTRESIQFAVRVCLAGVASKIERNVELKSYFARLTGQSTYKDEFFPLVVDELRFRAAIAKK